MNCSDFLPIQNSKISCFFSSDDGDDKFDEYVKTSEQKASDTSAIDFIFVENFKKKSIHLNGCNPLPMLHVFMSA